MIQVLMFLIWLIIYLKICFTIRLVIPLYTSAVLELNQVPYNHIDGITTSTLVFNYTVTSTIA